MSREMKHSGFPWIGEIPNDWEVIPIKRVKDTTHPYPIGDGDHGSIKPDDYCDEGIPYIRVQNMTWGGPIIMDNIVYISEKVNEQNKKSELHPNDILVAKTGATIGKTCIIPDDMPKANTTSSVGKITVGKSYSSKFIFYLLGSEVCLRQMWLKAGQKSAQPGFNIDELVDFRISVPKNISTQQHIADILDRKCSEIDKMTALQEQMIEELKAYKQSVIAEAITKGLNPDAPMKDSGIDWIGDIPEHWEIVRLKALGWLQNGLSKSGDYFGEEFQYPFVSYSDVYKNYEIPYPDGRADSTIEDRERYSLSEGDVCFTRTSETIEEIGFAATCMYNITDAVFSGFLIRFRPYSNKLFKGYSKYYFRSDIHRAYFVKEMNLVTRASLSQDLLKNLFVLVPPLSEQQFIASFLDSKCSEIDSLVTIKQQKIEELKEYRKSIIYEYVTGKKEVV